MKKLITPLALLGLIGILGGCAAVRFPEYYKDSNAQAIEQVVKDIQLDNAITKLPQGARLTVKNMEVGYPYYLDTPASYLVEQSLITKLTSKGFSVLERDQEIVETAIRESDKQYMFTKKVGGAADKSGATATTGSAASADKGVTINVENNCSKCDTCKSAAPAPTPETVRIATPYASSDFIAAYRILDCGVYYQEISSDAQQILRVTRLKMHLRISSTKTSEIFFSGDIEGIKTDNLDKKYLKGYESVKFNDFDFTHPNISSDKDEKPKFKLF
jgi:hypothetical protein